MKKIIGFFIFIIGLTASVLEIYSFVIESPWIIHQFDKIASIVKEQVQLEEKRPIQSSSSKEIIKEQVQLEEKRPIQSSSSKEIIKEQVKLEEKSPIQSQFSKETVDTSSHKILITNRTIDLKKLKTDRQEMKSNTTNENKELAITISKQPIDLKNFKKNLPPIEH